MSELKKCPFCGGEAQIVEHTNYQRITGFGVECCNSDCDIAPFTSYFLDKQKAINTWNRRKPVDDVVEALEKQLKSCEKEWIEQVGSISDRAGARMEAYSYAIQIVKEMLNE
jgi:Lar family restriction alleviation protein